MDEAVRFYANAMRLSGEIIELACGQLDEETVETIADALENGFRIVLLSDPTGIVIVLLDQRTGQLGPLIVSVDGRRGTEKVYGLHNGKSQPCRGARDAMTPGVMVARGLRAAAPRDA